MVRREAVKAVARLSVRRRKCGAIERQQTEVWRDSASGDGSGAMVRREAVKAVARFGVRRRKCGAIRRQA